MALTYTNTGAHITGVPAQDITDDNIKKYADTIGISVQEATTALINSGLYKQVSKPKKITSKVKDSE